MYDVDMKPTGAGEGQGGAQGVGLMKGEGSDSLVIAVKPSIGNT